MNELDELRVRNVNLRNDLNAEKTFVRYLEGELFEARRQVEQLLRLLVAELRSE